MSCTEKTPVSLQHSHARLQHPLLPLSGGRPGDIKDQSATDQEGWSSDGRIPSESSGPVAERAGGGWAAAGYLQPAALQEVSITLYVFHSLSASS